MYALSHWWFSTAPWGMCYYYLYFTHEETKAQRNEVIWLISHNWQMSELELKPRQSETREHTYVVPAFVICFMIKSQTIKLDSWVQIPTSPFSSYMTVSRWLHFHELVSLPVKWENNSKDDWRLNDLIYGKHLEHYLTSGKQYKNIAYNYYFIFISLWTFNIYIGYIFSSVSLRYYWHKTYVSIRSKKWWYDTSIDCETTIELVNFSIPSHNYLFLVAILLRSTLLTLSSI